MSTGGTITAPAGVLAGRVEAAIERHADAVALRVDDRSLTYAELGDAIDRAATVLAEQGVGRGTRVALSAGNSVEFAAAVFAMARLGATVVMISTAWREHEVGHAVELVRPTHVVHDGSAATDLTVLHPALTAIHVDDLVGAPRTATSAQGVGAAPDDVAVVFFSSGTTGFPKAVRHTHRSLSVAIDHWIESLGLTPDDRLQITTPPFHILGLLNLYAIVVAGASVRLHRRFDVDALLDGIERDRVTIEMAVAPIALALADRADLDDRDLSSLRYIMWGATPVVPAVAEAVTRRTGVPFLPAYGASELPVITANPVRRPISDWRLDSVGLPPTGVEVRVVDLATGRPAGAGQSGEIQVRSASVMLGYLPEDANADAFADGWYRTGDVGTIDADGWVQITDRVKEMVKVNGFQVAPAEIEALLLAHPDVVDCAVFGVPDPATGEAVIAALVLRDDSAAADAIVSGVGDQLASYKRIHDVVVVDQIPRLPSGKVLRRELQASYRS